MHAILLNMALESTCYLSRPDNDIEFEFTPVMKNILVITLVVNVQPLFL